MPAAIPIVAMGVAAALEAPAIVVAAAGIVGAFVAGSIQKDSIDTPAAGSGVADLTSGIRANTRTPSAILPIVYGKIRVGGNLVFIEAAGDNNDELWIVQNLSEGECDSIEQVDSTDQVFLNDKLYSEYGSNVEYWFHSGSDSQTYDSNLNAAISKWDDNKRNTCYMVYKLTYNKDYFQSMPALTVVLKGKKVYDFRTGSTAWSDNPVLALYDYMTNDRYGMGISTTKIDITSWTSAANYCETKDWKVNIRFDEDAPAADIRDALLALFRGQMVSYNGKYYLRYADLNYESSVATIEDNNIVQTEDGKVSLSISEPSRFDLPNAVRVRFIDEDKDYVEDSVLVGDETGVIQEIILNGCTSRQQAANTAVYMLERKKLSRVVSGTFSDDLLALEPFDVVTLNCSSYGIEDQLMRVQTVDLLSSGLVALTLSYEDSLLYDDDYNINPDETYSCELPDPNAEPPAVWNVQLSEETYNYRLRTFTRLKVEFSPPSDYPWFDYVEVWQSFDNSIWKHLFNASADFEIDNVQEGETYYLRLKTVSIWGVKQKDVNDYKVSKLILGYNEEPTSLTSLDAIVNQNAINLYSNKVDNPDIELYEFRLGSSWSGGIFLAALRSPNLSLFGVKPGSHTFWANTLSNNGKYGASPQSASVDLQDPPDGWTVQSTQTSDYSTGTHDNTEQTTYNSKYYLKCSHGSAGLSGTYKSSIFDLGASSRYLCYVLADIVVTGTGTTWEDVIPDNSLVSTLWSDIDIANRTWAEIFALVAGPQVRMRLYYGNSSPPTSYVDRMEILSAIVTGRYFQVQIEITDPSPDIYALVEHFTLKLCQ